MRHLLTKAARNLQTYSEPFWASARLMYINGILKYSGTALAALFVSMLFLTSAANAQFQLQRLYTAPNGSPPACLLQANDGNFYGTLVNPIARLNPPLFSVGYVFKMTPSGNVTTLTSLFGLNPELVQGDDGNFYGTAYQQPSGGATNGMIFGLTAAGQFTNVFYFDGTNGARPIGMRKGVDGNFYGLMGSTNSGHTFSIPSNHFTIFQYSINNGVTQLYSVTNGPEFTSIPVQGADGYLYGATLSGTSLIFPPYGNLLRVSFYRLSTSGNLQTIYTRTNAPGAAGDLIFGPDGNLYGSFSSDAGVYQQKLAYGSIFRISTNGNFSSLFSFNSTNGSDPRARLFFANDGHLYGTTFAGGISNRGTIFRLSVQSEFTSLIDFTGPNGASPSAPLIQATDGNLYGATESSTTSGIGTIFRLVQLVQLSNFTMSNGAATLTWNSFPNGIYRVEYKSALSDLSWVPLIQRVTATDQTITIVDTQAADPQRFYRVALLP
jgi:uncharacterized repeat protein (TIGR03803 family)